MAKKVFVTGGSGFIAKHILRELLEKGFEIRASVRSEKRKAEIEALFPDAGIEFAFLDLNSDEGWDAALAGCDVLMHTASPFPLAEPKDREELIRPAVDGTLRALRAAKEAGIDRVILTSSNAAIYKDAAKPKDAPSDETNWTTADADFVGAYEASKTLAERAAWDFVAQNPAMSLTTINPGAVFGPAMDANYGSSLEVIERVMSGQDPMAPPLHLPSVDVRDVAMMHVAAIDLDAAKGERFAATESTVEFLEIADILREWDPSLKMVKREAPVWLLRLMALFMADIRSVIFNVGRNLNVSGQKAQETFGFTFIPTRDAIIASAESIRGFKG
ncbi:MAG: NAD-dependent epimerase/dehydratase family protein [Pseudomonadota bacterium]